MARPVTESARRRRRRRKWPRRLAIALLVLMAPFIALVVYNRIDESPSARALQYSQPHVSIADEDNAWLGLVGIGAARDQDPLDWARQWVAAHNEGVDLPAVPTPHRSPEFATHGFGELCPYRDVPCLELAELSRPGIEALASENALRLQRYEKVLSLRGWRDLLRTRLDSPTPDGFQTALLYLDVQALALVRAIEAGDMDALRRGIEGIHAHAQFWSGAARHADSLLVAMVAATHIDRAQRLGAALVDRLRPEQFAAIQAPLGALLAIDPTEIEWEGAMAGEHRLFVHTVGESVGFWSALSRGALKEAVMGVFFAPQATTNTHARLTRLISQQLAAPLTQREAAQLQLQQFTESIMPPLGEAGRIPGYFAHNAVGKILVAIAIPAFKTYGDRVWDFEAARRASVLKLDALRNGIDPDRMAAFIGAQPLVDPWTGEPFAWDSLRREIHFMPGSEHWKSPRLAIPYRAVALPGVYACPQQWGVELSLGGGQPRVYRSCGDGLQALRMVAADSPEVDDDHDGSDTVEVLRLRGEGDRVWAEVWQRGATGEWRRYGGESRIGGEPIMLQALSRDERLDGLVRALAPRRDRWLSVHQPDPVPVAQLAAAFGRALQISTVGMERMAAAPLSLRRQGPAVELYPLLADAGEVHLDGLHASRVVFRAQR